MNPAMWRYAIQNDLYAEFYWSNTLGWIDFDDADLFTPDERLIYDLPIGGTWREIAISRPCE